MANEAVICTRLRAARAGDDETLDNQEATCRKLAQSHGLRVAEVFSEGSGVSAFKKNVARPELDALIAYVRQNPGSVVIAWEIPRLT
ncbi:MAG: recombinase family protein [Acidimicrobiales bacterium]|jgi:DNA invertase Pin-like site-specific DNA recombinase